MILASASMIEHVFTNLYESCPNLGEWRDVHACGFVNYISYTGWGPSSLAKLVHDTQIVIFRWGYKPTYNWGAQSCKCICCFCHFIILAASHGPHFSSFISACLQCGWSLVMHTLFLMMHTCLPIFNGKAISIISFLSCHDIFEHTTYGYMMIHGGFLK